MVAKEAGLDLVLDDADEDLVVQHVVLEVHVIYLGLIILGFQQHRMN